MNKQLSIQQASEFLGVSPQTLRRWEREGRIAPAKRTPGSHRRYDSSDLCACKHESHEKTNLTLAYARVSSHDQKEDLTRQENMLELFCASHGWVYEVLSDLGSGLNYHKKGLKQLIHKITQKEINRLVITHKDRLLRFGSELIFALCEENEIEVIIINKGSTPSFEEELAQDVLEIITVFSARLYGARSRKNKKLIENLKKAVDDSSSGD
jgi:putative resolvase